MAVQPIIDERRVIDDALIREVTEKIVHAFDPERIILFGSHARGDAGPESDLDLLVVMETDLGYFQRIPPVLRLFGSRLWPLDLFVFTPKEFDEQRDANGTLIEMAVREGKQVYARR
jgi:uncharacterized protein